MGLSALQTHYNRVLTGVSIDYRPPEYVAEEVVRPMKVKNLTDLYTVFDRNRFDTVNDIRSPGDPENQIDVGWRYEPYRIELHGLRAKLSKEEVENADDPALIEQRKVLTVKDQVLLERERRVFGTGGLLRTAANNTGTLNCDWTNLATASPRQNVTTAINAVEAAAAMTPNTIVLSKPVARHIMTTAEYREERQFTVDLSNQAGASDLPRELYGMRAVYVGALTNTARKGQATTLDRLMGEDVWIGYVSPNATIGQMDLTHSALIWNEEYARKWWDDDGQSWIVAYNYNYTPELVARECGYLLTSVLTA